jgi:trimeric autotransporter adhesin
MPADFVYLENDAEFFTTLRRRPHALVFNNTNILSDTMVLTMRYGWTTWQDQSDFAGYPPGLASLGFNPAYVAGLDPDGPNMFPQLNFNENTSIVGGWGGNRRRWNGPLAINGTLTKLWGNHSFKMGADVRELGISTTTETEMSGQFRFDRRFTSATGVNGSGHELASLLLGLPVANSGTNGSSVPVNRGELEWFTRYYGGYIQDDWRMSPKLSLNFGVRFEHEDGLREVNNQQTVGFDQTVVNPIDAMVNKTGTLLQGQTLRGGLLYAGVDGAPEEQGDPPALKVSPRVGVTYAVNSLTVIRGGYGLFYAPWNYDAAQHGQGPFARTTFLNQTGAPNAEVPITTLDNPFPGGVLPPIGSSQGLLGLVGGSLNVVDQNKGAPNVQQYSVDVQRELRGNMAVTIGYTGATGRDLGFAGNTNTAININQINPDVARQLFPGPNGTWNATALNASVPNPFFGIAAAGELGTRATVPAGQLIRPFPQYGDINLYERTEGGKRQYHAMILEVEKRLGSNWWGGRFSYTFSSTKDNQFGQNSTYATVTQVPQNVYDLDAEYSASNFDSPHRIILAPIVRFPSNSTGAMAWIANGWSASAIVELVSGAPLNATLSAGTSDTALGLLGGRQRPNVVGDPNISGSDDEKVDTAVTPGARWFSASAFVNPGAGQYGNAPRTLSDARLQFRKNLDLVVTKDVRFGGSQTAQVRFEILNLTNTAKFGGATNTTDTTTFGRIATQRGFMRIWQLSFRYGF